MTISLSHPPTANERVSPKECAAVVFELKKRPSPKSPNFTTADAVTNTLAGLMSEGGGEGKGGEGGGEKKGERLRGRVHY